LSFAILQAHSDRSAGALEKPGQIDVIIIDDQHPRFVAPSEPATYFIEAILSAGEIKSVLASQHLRLALEKAARFKTLIPTFGQGDMIFSNPSDKERFVNRRAYFLFAYESALSLEGIIAGIEGCLINLGDGTGSLKMGHEGNMMGPARWGNTSQFHQLAVCHDAYDDKLPQHSSALPVVHKVVVGAHGQSSKTTQVQGCPRRGRHLGPLDAIG
jgi:hypothetical protein